MMLIRLPDFLQHALVRLVQGLGQFLKDTADVLWEAILQCFELAKDPSEPVE